jgi:hypothetical protein
VRLAGLRVGGVGVVELLRELMDEIGEDLAHVALDRAH